MALRLLNEGKEVLPSGNARELQRFCLEQGLDVIFEWKEGQYWLHSDQKGELPIGISINTELDRHLQYFKKSSLHKELLARAIGIKGTYRPKILDLSGGLLGDSLLFLSMGLQVTALERHPVVAFLIESALENARHPLLSNFTFMAGDGNEFLSKFEVIDYDVIYYDPMFEDANDKSLPRKEMRIFRSLVGSDEDGAAVFKKAIALRPKRLVVKRPRLSRPIVPGEPLSYTGKATRYDVYLSQNDGPNVSNQIK